jgi:hypothetical protein
MSSSFHVNSRVSSGSRRLGLVLFGFAALLQASPSHACSLQFTSPLRGSTVLTATVGVSGTGSGTANSGDVGWVTATVNGTVFFSQGGVFTTLIKFLGSGAASAPLRPGVNVLQVSGAAGSCSASDQMVVYYTPPPPLAQKAAGAPLVCNGRVPIAYLTNCLIEARSSESWRSTNTNTNTSGKYPFSWRAAPPSSTGLL